ncbi:hypothetical protein EIP91_001384 [Steccherinum ochraceum]|uniref:BTB domain-containing protein n=1 Tax=Steccherinum ochraceum TaxID=92696 RepID=A0A4R0RHX2_9APHY|nr:hypothetical protein EIP91_001384 [Steccherinum ochraceum]
MDDSDDNTQELLADLEAVALMHGFSLEDSPVPSGQHEPSIADVPLTAIPVGTLLQEEASPPLPLQTPKPTYSVSTTFHSNSKNHDTVFVSLDLVSFYVDSSVLLSASQNAFNRLLSPEAVQAATESPYVVPIPEHSVLFNVVLHAIHQMSLDHKPPLDTLLEAIPALKRYGIREDHFIALSTPLFINILAETPRNPISVYLAAAEHKLEHLAVASSAHLHSFELSTLTDEMANRMGPRYLQRLFRLHMERTAYLKRLLLVAPTSHEDTLRCGFVEQKTLERAWALAAASLVWEVKPDTPAGVLRSTLGSLEAQLECDECKASLNTRVRQIVLDWLTNAKSTI